MADPAGSKYSITPETRSKGHKVQSAFAKGRMIEHAQELEESLMEAARAMREQLSAPAPPDGESASAAADRKAAARATAGVIAKITVGWDTILDRVRIIQGKPLPGQKRPVPDELKPKKATPINTGPDEV